MKVAIILINYKAYADRFLIGCVESIKKLEFPEGEYKIFIVDNATSIKTQNKLKQLCPEAEVVPNQENDFGGGNNLGIKRALKQGFEYLFVLNMDTEVAPQCLSKAIEVYNSDDKIGLLQSRLMLFENKNKINSLGNLIHYLGFGYCKGYQRIFKQRKTVDEITYPSGAAIFVSRERLKKIGFFVEGFFMYHEDLEWGMRSRLAGFKNVVANESVVYHKYEFSRSISKYFWMERNRFITFLMLYKWPTLIILFPAWILMEIGLFIFALKGGWWREKLRVYYWFGHLKNWQKVLNWRKEIQRSRKISDRELTADFVGKVEYQEPEMKSKLLKYIANPFFNGYWLIAKKLIFW